MSRRRNARFTSGTMEAIRFSTEDGIARLVLSRPDSLNAITVQMVEELAELTASLRDDPPRALIVTGDGEHFCSGLDLSESAAMFRWLGELGAGTEDPLATGIMRGQETVTDFAKLPFPTIAAIRGAAIGAGLELALACDLRIVARGAKLGLPEVRWGLIPDWGGTERLPRLVGLSRAKHLILTGESVDAETAVAWGLATQLADPADLEAQATSLAVRLAALSPIALAEAKSLLEGAQETTVEEGLARAAVAMSRCARSTDSLEIT